MSSRRPPLWLVAWLALLTGTVVLYGHTLTFGLRYDDWHLFRPWSWAELGSVWHGTWDPSGIESVYFRPLTATWYALMFWLFGWNGIALHGVSLLLHGTCAWMVFVFLRRLPLPTGVAMFGGVAYLVHPSLVYSQVAWLTNHMHALASIVVLGALLWWQRLRHQPLVHWWPLLIIASVAFGIKEDTVMLLPAIAGMTTVLAAVTWEAQWGRLLGVCAAAVCGSCALFVVRGWLLDVDVAWPTWDHATTQFERGWNSVLHLRPARRPWQGVASGIATATLWAALPLLFFTRRRAVMATFAGFAGLVMVCAFNLPFVLISKVEQYHLLTLGASLLLAGCAGALWAFCSNRFLQGLLLAVGTVALGSWAAVARHIAGDFAPCHDTVLRTDAIVREWWQVPIEARSWLDEKAGACRTRQQMEPVTRRQFIGWNVSDIEHDAGTPFRWTSRHATFMLATVQPSLTLAIRHPAAHADQPARVRLTGDTPTRHVTLTSPAWEFITLRMDSSLASWLRQMARIDLEVDSSWQAPAPPGGTPQRQLGVQIQVLDLGARR